MQPLYLHLYVEALVRDKSSDDDKPSVIGDFDTRHPPATESKDDDIVLSMV